MRRVVVTGMGVVSPFGVGIDAFWDGLTQGRSGVRRITRFDASSYPSQIAGEVPDFNAAAHLPRRDVVRTDAFIHFALISALAALGDSGVKIDGQNDRVGVSIGTGMGGVPLLISSWETLRREGMAGVSAYALPGSLPNMAAGWVSLRTGARGPLFSPTTACAASTQAVGDAFRTIQRGDADVMLAGGTDSLIHPLVIAGFSAIRALSTRNDDPQRASRPFDRGRDGFVLAEGAGILVLEALEPARARGAHIYAEVLGYGLSADAHHPTASSSEGPARAMQLALADARLSPEAVDYVNAHGTSTQLNDQHETEAIKAVFGDHARRLAVSSIKSMTGHLVGAAGGVEAIATVLALHHGVLPPTINHTTPDPACDLDYVPNQARRVPIRVAMSNSFAFGGTNAILVLGRSEE
ncbi:MAG TPA: beta-ketoacyl-ACP synthase II [Methylomirabilota bacterium]|jgi:3-oxoacyl-[acyl-carrier-protein] synthase II|nr:beta-ketoacyl-ACP synthase II [Methylomirabilota bacterium]